MALVALEFENNNVYVASARQAGKRLELNHLFQIQLDGSDDEAADLLRKGIAKRAGSRADAIIVISRSDAEMREIEVPPAPNNELPDMVRFLARNNFASMNDNWAFDFVPLSDNAESPRSCVAAAISPELESQVRTLAEKAGLRVKHIVLRPYAAADLLDGQTDDDQFRLLIAPNGDVTDMTLLHGTKMLATRSVRVPASYEGDQKTAALLNETKRTIASSRKSLDGATLNEIILFSANDDAQAFTDKLNDSLGRPCRIVDPLSLVSGTKKVESGDATRYAALAGALVRYNSSAKYALDFANPRRPIVQKKSYSKLIGYGSLAAGLLILASAFGWWTLNKQKQEIAEYQKEVDSLIEQNKGTENRPSVEDTLDEVGSIDNWAARNVNWLEEIYQYSERSLTPDDSIIDSFDAQIGRRDEDQPRIDINAKLSGIQREQDLINELKARPFLVSITRGGRNDDETYPFSTTMKVNLDSDADGLIKRFDEKADAFIKARNERMAQQAEAEAKAQTEADAAPEQSDQSGTAGGVEADTTDKEFNEADKNSGK